MNINKWELTMDIMDAAANYTKRTNLTEFRIDRTPAVALSLAIEERYGKVDRETLKSIANQAIEHTGELAGIEQAFDRLAIGLCNGYGLTH